MGTRPAPTVGEIVGAFKSITTHEYIQGVLSQAWSPFLERLWQRNYYEHILRNQKDLENTTHYITSNPVLWEQDDENPCKEVP
jgi:REP element-mobilizing transposase RayT